MQEKDFPVLSNPPINVAVFEIRYKSGEDQFPPKELDEFTRLVSKSLPTRSHNLNQNIDLNSLPAEGGTVKVSKPEITQLRYISIDKSKVLSITNNLFSLIINRPYEGWDVNFTLLQECWKAFSEFTLHNNFTITTASTRFINRIEIVGMESPADYFNTTIYASEKIIPGEVNSFLMKYISMIQAENTQVHVTQGFEPPIGNVSPYIFDIDVIAVEEFTEEQLWQKFSILRKIKNETFFTNLTERTLNLLA